MSEPSARADAATWAKAELILSTKHVLDEDDLCRSCLPSCWVCTVLTLHAQAVAALQEFAGERARRATELAETVATVEQEREEIRDRAWRAEARIVVLLDERDKAEQRVAQAVREGVAAEREACALIAENSNGEDYEAIANAIRAPGPQEGT